MLGLGLRISVLELVVWDTVCCFRVQVTHRPQSSSFLGLPYRILNMNPKKELLWGLWVIMDLAVKASGCRSGLIGLTHQSFLGLCQRVLGRGDNGGVGLKQDGSSTYNPELLTNTQVLQVVSGSLIHSLKLP